MDILLIDNSNIFVGVHRYPFQNARFDYLNFVPYRFERPDKVEKILVGSTPPPSDAFWNLMRNNGFKVVTFERVFHREKKVDSEIVAQGLDAIAVCDKPGCLVLMSGDSDMHSLVSRAHSRGWQVEIWTWKDSINKEHAQSEYVDVVRFIDEVQDGLVFHEPTDADPYRETYAQYMARKENERIEREKERERQRIEREKECERQRIESEKEIEHQKNEKELKRKNIWKGIKKSASWIAGAISLGGLLAAIFSQSNKNRS